MNKNLFAISVLLNIFFPGLGNIVYGQRKAGVIILVASRLLTILYATLFCLMFVSEKWAVLFMLLAFGTFVVAFSVNMALVIISVLSMMIFKTRRLTSEMPLT